MVQLKRSTLPRRRRLRSPKSNKGGKPISPIEWAVLLTALCVCTYLLSFFFDLPSLSGSIGGSGQEGSTPQVRRVHGHAVAHGRGRRVPELSDRYNAIANDVLQILDCAKPVSSYYGSGGGTAGYDANGGGGYNNGGGEGGEGMWDDFLATYRDGDFDWNNNNNNGKRAKGERAAAAANLDDDGKVPAIMNRDNNNNNNNYQMRRQRRRRMRRRLQMLDDDGGRMVDDGKNNNIRGGEGNIVRDDFGDGYDPNLDDFAEAMSGDWGENGNINDNYKDDWGGGGMDYGTRPKVNGRHLLCLAAGADDVHPEAKKPVAFQCDVLGTKRELLLDLWESARGQQIPADVIVQLLDHAYEHTQKLLDHEVHLWSPWDDEGLKYTLNEINVGKEWNRGGLLGLDSALGPHKLFVDVGSNLGLTAMAVSLTYPGTAVIAIEPAAPSWFMQELNLRCNSIHPQPHISSVLAGVGPKNNGMSKMMWRPTSTTSTRAWTPKSEHKSDDIELTVHMRTMRAIIAEGMPDDLPYSTPISVMNLDCEGCEYDVVPAFTEADFDAIDIVLGEIHWGYIPSEKLPSSDRAAKTHKRLCRHEPFARNAIECCAFKDMEVDTLVDTASTVGELAGPLCDTFDTWAEAHDLYNIPDDVGWFELSAELDY